MWGIHRWPGKSPHKGPVTRKMFPFDDVIMTSTWPNACCDASVLVCILQMKWCKQPYNNGISDVHITFLQMTPRNGNAFPILVLCEHHSMTGGFPPRRASWWAHQMLWNTSRVMQKPVSVMNTWPQTSNIRSPLLGNKIVDHSDLVGATTVDAAPTTSSFSN